MLIENPDDASWAPLGILRNMQIRAAITEISLFYHNLVIQKDKRMIFVSTPRFSGSLNQIRPKPKRFAHLHMHNMQIRAAITEISLFYHNLVI